MISLEECKKYIGKLNLPDQKIEEIRDALYVIVENVLDIPNPSGTLYPADNPDNKLRIIAKTNP